MQGSRLYVHQRVFRRYGQPLRRVADTYACAVRGVKSWFVDGLGELIIRWLVIAAGALALLYVAISASRDDYLTGNGMASAVGSFLLVIFILGIFLAIYTYVVYRISTSLAALAGFLGMSLVGIILGAAVAFIFALALAVLFLWTILSALFFFPLRFGHSCWLLYRKIKHKCPYDDCRHTGLPIHVCSCGAEYPDLEPNRYGIFHHSCQHGQESVKLPTLFGRNRLPRLCGGCHRPLIHTSLGELREWPVFVVGAPNAGKTMFLAQAVRRLIDTLSRQPHAVVHIDSDGQQRDHTGQLELLDHGRVLAKTAEGTAAALGIAVRIPKGLHALVYLFDKPGEYFQSMQRFGRLQAIEGLRGAILVVDPFSLPALEGQDPGRPGLAPEVPFYTVAANLIHAVEAMLPGREKGTDLPLAVVLSKADALPANLFPFLTGLVGVDHENPDDLNERCRQALERLGATETMRMLQQKFQTVRYFSCTATGRVPDAKDRSSFRPAGVEAPLLWLLGAPADAGIVRPSVARLPGR